jgi:hypothetical protein
MGVIKTTIPLALLKMLAVVCGTYAVIPPPDAAHPGRNTAEEQNALLNLTMGDSTLQ